MSVVSVERARQTAGTSPGDSRRRLSIVVTPAAAAPAAAPGPVPAVLPGRAPVAAPDRVPAAAPRPAPVAAIGPARLSRPAGAAALRLTRRGRVAGTIVAMLAVIAVVTTAWTSAAGGAEASSHAAVARSAYRGMAQIVVRPGQTLWSVAAAAEPSANPWEVVQQIISVNALPGQQIQAGQLLWVPRG